MAMKISRSRRVKKKDLPKFDKSVYSKVTLSKLIVYSVHFLIEQGIEVTMDDVVLACFRLFPQKFALKKYPRLPDSAVVNRHWHYCRSKRYIAVNTDFGFKLTVKGERLARKVAKALGVKIPRPRVKAKPSPIKVTPKKKATPPVIMKQLQLPQPQPKPAPKKKVKSARPVRREKIIPPESLTQTVSARPEKANTPVQSEVAPEAKIRAGKFVRMMETSDAYIQYKKNGRKSNISEFDFRSLLLCTMESSAETLAKNVEQFKGYAGIHNRQDMIAFLDFCRDKFLYLLAPQKKTSGRPVPRIRKALQ